MYYLFVPQAPPPAGGYSLLVLLHGSGRDGTSLIDRWKGLAAKEGIILAAPNSANRAYWTAPADGPELLHQIVERLRADYPVNSRRIYLFGHSGGAVFAIGMSIFESEYFAAAAIHAGAFRSANDAPAGGALKRAIPLAMFSGTNDPFFPIGNVRATAGILRNTGLQVTLTEIPHHDHDYYGIASKLNETVWKFLKEQELTTEPKYRERHFTP